MVTILLSQSVTLGIFSNSFGNTAYAQSESEFLPYENTEIGISITYPKNWQMIENPDEFTLVSFNAPLDSPSDQFQESLMISAEGVSESITLDEFADATVNSIANEFTLMGFNVDILNSESITISGNNAKKITYTIKNGGVSFEQVFFITIKENIAYSIIFTSEEEKFSEYVQTLEKMINSIKIGSLSPLLQYENPTHGIKIEYPSSWTKSELSEPTTTIMFTAPIDDLQDVYQETFAIVILDSPVKADPSQYADSVMEGYRQQFSNFNLVESSEIILSGNPAVKKIYTATNAGFDLKGLNIFLAIETKNYMIQFTSDSEKRFSEYLPVVQEMIDSIVIDSEIIPTEFEGKYVDDKVGIEIDFPKAWKGIKMKQEGMNIVFATPGITTKLFSSEVDPNFAAMLVLTGDLKRLPEMPKAECDKPYQPAKILELNGMKALEFTGKCLEPTMNVKMKMTGYLIATSNDFVDIGYVAGSDKTYDKEISKFYESLETLKISNTIDISNPSNYADIFGLEIDKKSVQFDGQTVEIDIVSNSTISDFTFDSDNEKISFGTLEQSGTGLTEIFIGKVLEPPYAITIDGKNIDDFTITYDETINEILVSFDYNHPVKQVVVEGKLVSENSSSMHNNPGETPKIPDWIRNNASWWVEGNIDDQAFVGGIQFLIKEGIIQIPETAQSATGGSQEIPAWIKNNADWWSQGLISDNDFLKGITFMVEKGIIVVN